MKLEVIYQDPYLIAINKPHGLLVHRSKYADDVKVFAMQELRDQIGQFVYPCHRIDRKTSGVLLFTLDEPNNSLMQQQFAANMIKKKYLAIVRGFTNDNGTIDYALVNEKGKEQEALTHYKTIQKSEIDVPFSGFNTSRYSLVEAYPQSGRLHQIRKHLAHIHHPIIGDRPHGCNKQNKLFREKWEMMTMMLHAAEIEFQHPVSNENITITAKISSEFERVMRLLSL
ncbi:MAG: pseudouridine synthase [Salinivirgaceae bacterium]|nr:pseudouridine synthase [Salinivirgaceae bacterium]